MTETEFFSTTDLPLAATLICLGYNCDVDSSNNIRAKFYFKNSEKLEQDIKNFWTNEIKVSPKDFSNAQRDLKARIRERENV